MAIARSRIPTIRREQYNPRYRHSCVFMSPVLSEWAESRVYISDDSTHDNEFWKHCAEDTIKVYKDRIGDGAVVRGAAHLDTCAG